jgi:hypothetical protein
MSFSLTSLPEESKQDPPPSVVSEGWHQCLFCCKRFSTPYTCWGCNPQSGWLGVESTHKCYDCLHLSSPCRAYIPTEKAMKKIRWVRPGVQQEARFRRLYLTGHSVRSSLRTLLCAVPGVLDVRLHAGKFKFLVITSTPSLVLRATLLGVLHTEQANHRNHIGTDMYPTNKEDVCESSDILFEFKGDASQLCCEDCDQLYAYPYVCATTTCTLVLTDLTTNYCAACYHRLRVLEQDVFCDFYKSVLHATACASVTSLRH